MAAAAEESASTESGNLSRLLTETVLELPQTLTDLDRASRHLPIEEDFHFYNNFDAFREPVKALMQRAANVMSQISCLNMLRGASAMPDDGEDLYDWLVNLQDDLLEHVDTSFDEFKIDRAKKGLAAEDDGFMIQDRKKRRKHGKDVQLGSDISIINIAKEKNAIRFHKWELARPQEKFADTVDNSNTPFMHPNSAHPLQEKLVSMDFGSLVEISLQDPPKPKLLTHTPFTFVNTASALVEVASKLLQEREIAVDLEHHQFRSFQGFTCLMQISTRTEDFIIDTLELRHLIGPQLRSIFSNDAIQKVMHGADKDITWLQRDFGIYVCNLFDTGQAARVLKMEKYSLAYLLEHFCEVTADKIYQMADWRDRPLSDKMMKYAREDTHYLLYVGDKMKQLLVSTNSASDENLLLEVYKRSRNICLKLYEKEITKETSYLQVFGLVEKNFQAENLAVLAGLHAWRDKVSREEDESTGYVLPNSLLLRLAEEMPDNPKKLHSILHKKTPLLVHNFTVIIDIINKSRLASSNFEDIAARLRAEAAELVTEAKKSLEEINVADHKGDPGISNIVTEGDQNNDRIDAERSSMLEDEVNFTVVPISSLYENVKEIGEGVSVSESPNDRLDVEKSTTLVDGATFSVTPMSSLCGDEKEIGKGVIESESSKQVRHEGHVLEKEISRGDKMAFAEGASVIVKRSSTPSLFGKQRKVIKTVNEPRRLSEDQGKPSEMPKGKQMERIKTINESQESVEDPEKQDKMDIEIDDSTDVLGRTASLHIEAVAFEQVEAQSKAERIKTSFSLPFHTFDSVDNFDKSLLQKEKQIQCREDRQAADTVKLERKQIEDITYIELDANESYGNDETEKGIAFNADDRHRLWGSDNTLGGLSHESVSTMVEKQVDTSFNSDSEPRLPLSVSQRYRAQSARSESTFFNDQPSELKQLTQVPCKKAMTENHVVAVTPFDYTAAKEKMGYLRELRDNKRDKRVKQTSTESQTDSSSKAIFDPNRRVDGFKPEGITPGKRRQVFPQTGNRTGVFK